jgi:hypothetical protein
LKKQAAFEIGKRMKRVGETMLVGRACVATMARNGARRGSYFDAHLSPSLAVELSP